MIMKGSSEEIFSTKVFGILCCKEGILKKMMMDMDVPN